MKKYINSIVILVCICAAVAIVMAITNSFTAPIISKNDSLKSNAALLEVMPNGESFEQIDLSTYTLPETVTEAYKAKNGGYVIKLTTSGYSSGMVIMCGVNADGTVSGAVCLASTETLGKEQTYGTNFVGKDAAGVDAVDTLSGATMTTGAYRSAIKDAINASVILGGGSVDLRSEEEILQENLANALPAANGEFEKYFFVEEITGIDAIYLAKNASGAVCVIGEQFIATDANGNVTTVCDGATKTAVSDAIAKVNSTTFEEIDLSAFELSEQIKWVKRTASGNYLIEVEGLGYGIKGESNQWHQTSGKPIVIHVSMAKDGKIIDCLTVSQAETDNVGGVCATEEFYSKYDGKTADNYEIDVIAGVTFTINGYNEAIGIAFDSVKILEGGAK